MEERSSDGLSIAYALSHNKWYDEWTFVSAPAEGYTSVGVPIAATCIEGIAVELGSPGFAREGVLAIANATGNSAPKTNVARSALEESEGKAEATKTIYQLLVGQVRGEIERMVEIERYPLSRVINQIPFLAEDLSWHEDDGAIRGRPQARYQKQLQEVFSSLTLFLMEDKNGRSAASLDDLRRIGSFWTIESALTSTLEGFIAHMPVDVTARAVLGFAQSRVPKLRDGALISNLNSRIARSNINGVFEVVRARAVEEGHRLEMEWGPCRDRWISSDVVLKRMRRMDYRQTTVIRDAFERRLTSTTGFNYYRSREFKIAKGEVIAEGLSGFSAVRSQGAVHVIGRNEHIERIVADLQSEKLKTWQVLT